jgi:hypothetical protein
MSDCPQYTSAVIIDDSVTKLAVLIDADNAQLSAINLVLLEIWYISCEAGVDPLRYSIS